MTRTPRSALRRARLVCALAALATASLLAPAVATAHTKLLRTQPADRTVVPTPPEQVVLVFSTDVSETLDEIKVIAPDGIDVAGEPDVRGSTVRVPVDAAVRGRYLVGWRSVGADGHPIRGDFEFTARRTRPGAGAPAQTGGSASTGGNDRSLHAQHAALGDYPTGVVEGIYGAFRVLYYLSLLAVVGAAAFITFVAPGWRPRYLRRSLVVLVVSSLATFGCNLALAGEYGLGQLLDPGNIASHASTPVGRTALLSTLLAAFLLREYRVLKRASLAGKRRPPVRLAVVAGLLGVTPAFGGHAVAGDLAWLRVPLDMVHLLAAGVWFGGIVQLRSVATAKLAMHPAVLPAAHRFAQLAFASVIVLVVTGAIATVVEVGLSASDLFGTGYGQLVLVKLVLLTLTIPLARANQLRNVPALGERRRSSPRDLRRYVAIEIVLLVGIVVATAWLVYATPPREAHDMQRVGHTG